MPLITKGEAILYSLAEASSIICKNKWDTPVQGVHSETLRREWRDSNGKFGTRIGRDVWFSADDLMGLGYKIDEPSDPHTFFKLGEVIEIIGEGE
tara:strand:+ start:115 stop:399 length:285 start_codon:yes stop_codon:yes gene_type:complete